MEPTHRPLDVVAVGELNPDLVLAGIGGDGPVLGTEVEAASFTTTLGSSTAICTVGLARLGAATALVSRVGEDEFGAFCRRVLIDEGVDVSGVRTEADVATGVTVSLAYPHDRMLVTHPGTMQHTEAGDVPLELLQRGRHLHTASVFLQPRLRAGLPQLFARAREAGLSTSLDTGWDPAGAWERAWLAELLPHVSMLLPNGGELAAMSGYDDPEDGIAWALDLGAECVALKQGAAGATARWRDGDAARHGGFRVRAVDSTGAGDSFDAGFLWATLRGLPPQDRLRVGNACGALACTGLGGTGGFRSLDQVVGFLERAGESSPTLGVLAGEAAASRERHSR